MTEPTTVTATAPQPRRIMLLVTEAEPNTVIVQPPGGGAPRVFTGEAGAKLYAMVMDPANPPFVTEEGITGREVFESVGRIIKAWGQG